MNNSRVRSWLCCAAIVLAFVMAFPPGALAQDEGGPEQVTLTVWLRDHPARASVDRDLIARFMEANPHITVALALIAPEQYDDRLRVALINRQGPDLFMQWSGEVGNLLGGRFIAPLDPLAAGFAEEEGVYEAYAHGEALLSVVAFDGQLYGLPLRVDTLLCYANDDLWEAAGLDPEADFPATWEAMREVAEQLTQRDGDNNILQRGFDFNWSAPLFMWLQFEPMVRQLGGALIDEANSVVALATPAVAQVMAYWRDWAGAWALGGPRYKDSRSAFLTGELATECSFGVWGAQQIEAAGVNWSAHPAPRWEGAVEDNGLALYADFLMVNAGAPPPAQRAAWQLAGFLLGYPERYFTEAGHLQPRADWVNDERFQPDALMQLALREMAVSFYPPRVPGFMAAAGRLAAGRTRVLQGEDIDQVLAALQADVEQAVDDAARDLERVAY